MILVVFFLIFGCCGWGVEVCNEGFSDGEYIDCFGGGFEWRFLVFLVKDN